MSKCSDFDEPSNVALDCALRLLADGDLTDIINSELVRYRYSDGSAGTYLASRTPESSLGWYFAADRHESRDKVRARLLKEHSYWVRARRASGVDDIWHRAKQVLALEPGMSIDEWGIKASARWHERHPVLVLMVNCLGRDAEPGVDRVLAPHAHEVVADLKKITARHKQATAMAASWSKLNAIGAIDVTAASVVDVCGLDLRTIVAELKYCRESPFEHTGKHLRGWFSWDNFRIVCKVEGHPRWSLDGNVLTVRDMPLPETVAQTLSGEPLVRLIPIDELPGTPVMDSFEQIAAGALKVTLRPASLPITRDYALGQSKGGRARSETSG